MEKKFTAACLPVFILCLLSLSACSYVGNKAVDPQAALQNRVEQLWQARMAKDNNRIYELTDRTFRENVSRDDFVKKTALNVLAYETREITITDRSAVVKSNFESQKMGMKMRLNMNELWVLEAGQWYLNLSEMTQRGPFGKWGK